MRVLHVLPSISSKLGGPSEVAFQLVRGLIEEGISAEIATTDDDRTDTLPIPSHCCTLYRDVPVWVFPREQLRRNEFIPSRALAAWLMHSVRNYDFVDIHYLFTFSSTVASYAARWSGVPYSVRTMGQLAPWSLAQSGLLKRCYRAAFDNSMLRKAALVHCTSNPEADDAQAAGVSAPIRILPLGVERTTRIANASAITHSRYKIPMESPILLFLSRLHPKKRPDLLIQALKSLGESSRAHLIIAGDGAPEYLDELKRLAYSLALKDRVHFIGFIGAAERSALLQGCDVYILPSHSDNFALALAEALEAGAAIITTKEVQISPEIVEAQAGVVLQDVEKELSKSIRQLIENPLLRQELGARARDLAHNKYNWKAIVKDLVKVYSEAISN